MNYICETCDFYTDKKYDYERHLTTKKHKNKNKRKFKCHHCEKSYTSKQNLNYHLQVSEHWKNFDYDKTILNEKLLDKNKKLIEQNNLLLSEINSQKNIIRRLEIELKFRKNTDIKNKPSRQITPSTKHHIANRQKYKCANNPNVILKGIGEYKCPLWQSLSEGTFDASGFEIDHIEEFSISQNDDHKNLQALCLMCHRVKTLNFMRNKKKQNSENEDSESDNSESDNSESDDSENSESE